LRKLFFFLGESINLLYLKLAFEPH
jgi:hypothetical protein